MSCNKSIAYRTVRVGGTKYYEKRRGTRNLFGKKNEKPEAER